MTSSVLSTWKELGLQVGFNTQAGSKHTATTVSTALGRHVGSGQHMIRLDPIKKEERNARDKGGRCAFLALTQGV